ncbi:MAG: alpha/beta hydrolase, partial [Novosphingobium sp.]
RRCRAWACGFGLLRPSWHNFNRRWYRLIWPALILMSIALCALIPATPDRLPVLVMGFYWLASMMGQIFALPLLIGSAVLATFAGKIALWLLVGAAAVFAVVHLRNRQAARVLLAAVGLTVTRVSLLAGLTPFLTGRGKTRRISDLAYGEAGKRNLLDVVVPRAPPSGAMPVLIHLHGGAWTIGNKNEQGKPLLHHMAARGWVCFDVTYRLGPNSRGPDWIVDVLRAIAWVREHAAEYGGDPDRIAITGGSAGGHLAALAALTHDDPAFKPGFEYADCSVAAAVPLYGRYDFLDRNLRLKRNHAAVIDKFMAVKVMPGPPDSCRNLWHAVSPLDRVRKDAPPMLIVHGTGDTMLPWQDAGDFADSLRAISDAQVSFVRLPGIQHAWDMAGSAATWGHVRAVAAFLAPLETPGQAFLPVGARGLP